MQTIGSNDLSLSIGAAADLANMLQEGGTLHLAGCHVAKGEVGLSYLKSIALFAPNRTIEAYTGAGYLTKAGKLKGLGYRIRVTYNQNENDWDIRKTPTFHLFKTTRDNFGRWRAKRIVKKVFNEKGIE